MSRTCLTCGLETEDDIDVCPNDGTPMKSKSRDPLIGSLFLNKYEITDLLGRGGMSAVYKGRQMLMDRWVAIKVLRAELIQDQLSLKRFQQESKAASMLSHPNVIGVHDFDVTSDGVPYLIMDFVDGRPISSILRREGPMHPARCVFLFSQACSALAHAHSKGVVHRDIKPSNLMVLVDADEVESLKLVDFGIAKLLEFNKDKPRLTMTGEIFGSPTYMSPEQCGGKAIDARSDIYSLGCVIYECLMGEPPIRGETLLETIFKHVNDEPKPFSEVRPDLNHIPKALEKVVLKALEKSPDRRHQTMTEFDNELKASYRDYIKEVTQARNKLSVQSNQGSTSVPGNSAAATAIATGVALSVVSFAGQVTDKSFACSGCNKQNPFGLIYCQYCGEKANDSERTAVKPEQKCGKCGSSDYLNGQFCVNCGSTLQGKSRPGSLKTQSNSGGPIKAVAVICLVAIVGAGVWWFGFRPGKQAQADGSASVTQPTALSTAPPPADGDRKEAPAIADTPKSSKIQALDKPWIVVRTIEAAVVKGKLSQTTRQNDFQFRDGNKIFYTVQAQPAIPSPCYIYALDKAKTPAKVLFFSEQPISAGQTIPISDSKSIKSVEPFMLDDGPAEDNVIIVASPARIPSLEKKYCGPIFEKALTCVGANPDGVAASEKDIGVGESTTPSLSLTYLTTYHKPK